MGVVGHANSREMFQTNLVKWARSNEPSLDNWIEKGTGPTGAA